jgi:hypothetical protein
MLLLLLLLLLLDNVKRGRVVVVLLSNDRPTILLVLLNDESLPFRRCRSCSTAAINGSMRRVEAASTTVREREAREEAESELM